MNNTSASLLMVALFSWLFFPAFAAAIALLALSVKGLVWAFALFAAASVLFETPREWILDRFN